MSKYIDRIELGVYEDGAHGVRHGSSTLPHLHVCDGAHGDRHGTNALPRLHIKS